MDNTAHTILRAAQARALRRMRSKISRYAAAVAAYQFAKVRWQLYKRLHAESNRRQLQELLDACYK